MWWFMKCTMTLQMWTCMHTNLSNPIWHWFCGTVAQIFKGKKQKPNKCTTCGMHQCGIQTHFFQKNALQMQNATCKRLVYTIQWPLASTLHVGIRKWLFCPISPTWQNSINDWWWQHHWTDPQKKYWIHMKSNLEHAKKCQGGKGKKASSWQKNSTTWWLKTSKSLWRTSLHVTTLKKCNCEVTDSDSDSEYENYRMEDVSLDLKDVSACNNIALSDLGKPW